MSFLKSSLLFLFIFLETSCCLINNPRNSSSAKITFFDVGEGDSIFIESGGETALVDAGNLISGQKIFEFLRNNYSSKLDNLILTHPHPDHVGGAFYLAQNILIKKTYDNGENLTKEYLDPIYRWYDELFRKKLNAEKLYQNSIIRVGQINLYVLWPRKNMLTSDLNTNSLILLLEYGDFICLLMGDANFESEKLLFEDLPMLDKKLVDKIKKAKVLKAGHHGAEDTASHALISNIKPELTIISVNSKNYNNYPSKKTLEKYASISKKIWQTDICGDITLNLYKSGHYQSKSLCD